jgi:uncharacterized membrane protein
MEAKVGGKSISWDAEIIEQVPDERIVWRSVSGKRQGVEMVTFKPKAADRTESSS